MTNRNRYYAIEHPRIGESVLEYNSGNKNPVDLLKKTEARCLPTNDMLLFRLEPANYKPAPGEDMPCLAQLTAEGKGLTVFERSNQFSMNQITPQKAKEIVDFYRQKETQ